MNRRTLLQNSAYFSCLGELNASMISSIRDLGQKFFQGEINSSHFVIFLDSERGEPLYAQTLAYHLKDMQDSGIETSIYIERFALSAAAILVLYAKYLGVNVYASRGSIVMFHEPIVDYGRAPLSSVQNAIARDWEILQENLRVYSELSGISTAKLHEELRFEKELNVDTLYERHLIDAIVE